MDLKGGEEDKVDEEASSEAVAGEEGYQRGRALIEATKSAGTAPEPPGDTILIYDCFCLFVCL